MGKISLRDLPEERVRGRRALVRVDYNVPVEEGRVRDPTRVRASLPTLRLLLSRDARPVLASHLGRPGGAPEPDLSLRPVVPVLEEELNRPVRFAESAGSEEAVEASRELEEGEVLLMENTRFLPGETGNDSELSRRLARCGDLFVNDAFGASHRAHASVVGVPAVLRPAVAGLLVRRELEALRRVREADRSPLVLVLGGAKVGDKIPVLETLLDRADAVLVGGAMANTFLAAAGADMGRSRVEEKALPAARRLRDRAGSRLRLPRDLIVAAGPEATSGTAVPADGVPADHAALDIGPETRGEYGEIVEEADLLFWNGPMGLFERPPFDEGTRAVARAAGRATGRGAFTVVGGGDSARALREAGLADQVSHLSTGGGAALEFVATGTLPGIDVLDDLDEL